MESDSEWHLGISTLALFLYTSYLQSALNKAETDLEGTTQNYGDVYRSLIDGELDSGFRIATRRRNLMSISFAHEQPGPFINALTSGTTPLILMSSSS